MKSEFYKSLDKLTKKSCKNKKNPSKKNPVKNNPLLPVTDYALHAMKKNYSLGAVIMSPQEFLALTIPDDDFMTFVNSMTEEYEFYESAATTDMMPYSFLMLDIHTGKVTSHEGRHRANAAKNEGLTEFMAFIVPAYGDLTFEEKTFILKGDATTMIPKSITGEFTDIIVPIRKKIAINDIKTIRSINGHNPKITAQDKVVMIDDKFAKDISWTDLKDNMVAMKLPTDELFMFPENNYYLWLCESEERADKFRTDKESPYPFFPHGNFIGMRNDPFKTFFKLPHAEGIIAAMRFIVDKDANEIYIEWMGTRPGYKGNRLMWYMFEAIMDRFKVKRINFGTTTPQGSVFAKKFEKRGGERVVPPKLKKNPEKKTPSRYAALSHYNGRIIISRAEKKYGQWLIGGDVLRDYSDVSIFDLDKHIIYKLKGSFLVFGDNMSESQIEWFNEKWEEIKTKGIIE